MRSKTENELKSDLVKAFSAAGGYAKRIEDQFSVGFPDMLLVTGHYTFLCEAKRVEFQQFKPRERQYVELCRIAAAGNPRVVPCVLGFKDGLIYLHPHAKVCRIDDCHEVDSKRLLLEFDAFAKRTENER